MMAVIITIMIVIMIVISIIIRILIFYNKYNSYRYNDSDNLTIIIITMKIIVEIFHHLMLCLLINEFCNFNMHSVSDLIS